jgi:4-hydroxybenzoate polyprenyltransferase
MWILQMIRLPNLLIMGVTQIVILYQVTIKALVQGNIHTEPISLQLWILILGTIFIGAAGNIWNDYNDLRVDKINRPGKVYIGTKIGLTQVVYLAIATAIAGILCGVVLSVLADNFLILLIFVGTASILYFYSTALKKKPLIGNASIALLCSLVIGITGLLFLEELNQLSGVNRNVFRNWLVSFTAFCSFSFLGTFSREMIKDLEDLAGDSLHGIRTFPIEKSVEDSKRILRAISIILFILISVWGFILIPNLSVPGITYIVMVLAVLIALEFFARLAKDSPDYSKLSLYWKCFFVFGLGLAFLLPM